ncbi:YqaA family protein [Halopelagius longus]|uniref:DedA family protein n=1 Tax=Halopelagius longus TaxID=1236180 RepID=A0A1H1GRT3_9EURY|nr:YqaA family protein [Halopelagius longus]RDI69526.1 DedA family protein [Halopelagius longus]SDR15773.1 membrane protein YqaA, SNARE-associated domain [Halopelagius longus]
MTLGDILAPVAFSREFFVSFGTPGLFAVAFLEFCLLPVPPDLVLIPLAVAQPELAFVYAAIATASSVTAGLVGYGIGRKGGRPLLESRFDDERAIRAERYFERYGLVTLSVRAFAPIPEGYELLSVASGVLGLDLRSYVLTSLLGRGGKYFLEAALVLAIGEAARTLTEVELYSIIGVVSLVVVTAYLLRRRLVPDRWQRSVE